MKAHSADFWYGVSKYPVADANLPEVDFQPIIKQLLDHMGKLSGGFTLDQPDLLTFEISGNGYSVRFIEHDSRDGHEILRDAAREAVGLPEPHDPK